MADIVLITGASGLIGSEAVTYFSSYFDKVVGVDNNMRKYFFGEEGSVEKNTEQLNNTIPNLLNITSDIRDYDSLEKIFQHYGTDLKLIIHTAAQPSHDWAAKEPFTDYGVNSTGTLNLLELTRKYCPEAVFLFTSTSKVYGDNPNKLPLIELERRWDLPQEHQYYEGIDEYFSIDNTKHSLFGCSKVSADIYVQEYGRYFGMKTAIFRPGCLTGGRHNGAELHGFLNYLVKCVLRGTEYKISILEAFDITEQLTGKKAVYRYVPENRIGDHIWWISDTRKFRKDFPDWKLTYNITNILQDIINSQQ